MKMYSTWVFRFDKIQEHINYEDGERCQNSGGDISIYGVSKIRKHSKNLKKNRKKPYLHSTIIILILPKGITTKQRLQQQLASGNVLQCCDDAILITGTIESNGHFRSLSLRCN